jgi:hypothetical protein
MIHFPPLSLQLVCYEDKSRNVKEWPKRIMKKLREDNLCFWKEITKPPFGN